MRVLLDECLPRGLTHAFGAEHQVTTVPEQGWAGKNNGELLQLASPAFDVFVTIDRGLPYQQHLVSRPIAVVSNQLASLAPLMPELLEQLPRTRPGQVLRVGTP